MPVDFGLYSQKSTATSTPSRSMYSSKRCGTRVPSSSYSSRREGEPYWAAHSLQESFRVGRRAAWTWAPISGIPFSKLPAPLDDHRDALPHPYAHRCEAVPHVGTPPHLVHQRRQDASARSPQRVPESYRAAVGVQPLILGVHPPLVEDGQRLCRKRLVQLDQANVIQRDSGPVESFLGCGNGPYSHDPRRHPRYTYAPYLRHRFEPSRLRVVPGDDHHRRGPVVQGAGVASCDRSTLLEGWPELGELLERGVAPRSLVGLDHRITLAPFDRDRHDLLTKSLLVHGGHALLVARQRETVLLLAGDIVGAGQLLGLLFLGTHLEALLSQVLGGYAKRVSVAQRLHPRVDEAPSQGGVVHRGVAGRERPLRLGDGPRGAAHGLHPAPNVRVGFA